MDQAPLMRSRTISQIEVESDFPAVSTSFLLKSTEISSRVATIKQTKVM